ncbi:hypothetical protein D3C81_869320 [compost metagenome]
MVGHLVQRRGLDLPAVGRVAAAHDHRHHRVVALQGELHRRLAHRLGLFPVGFGGDVARRALQVIRKGPMHLEAQLGLHPAGEVRRHAAQLGVAERVLDAAGIGDELAIGSVDAFAGHHDAEADLGHHLLHLGQENSLVIGAFWKQDDLRRIVRVLASQAGRGSQPARMATHRFVDEDAGGGFGHRGHIQRRFAHRHGGVLRRRTEARAGVGDGKIVVDGLGHTNAGQRVAILLGQL